MSMKRNSESGFTLVELLCTISILGLISSLALPNVSTLMANATDMQLKYQITSQLDEAQLIAMAKETEVFVRFTDHGIITVINGKIIQQSKLPNDITIVSNYHQNQVTYQETGQVRGGTIVLKRSRKDWMKVVIQVASGTTKVVFP
jgi:prepilin-type N-terminal cleavage/methylation domain-containing protein